MLVEVIVGFVDNVDEDVNGLLKVRLPLIIHAPMFFVDNEGIVRIPENEVSLGPVSDDDDVWFWVLDSASVKLNVDKSIVPTFKLVTSKKSVSSEIQFIDLTLHDTVPPPPPVLGA
jgi:hypothetical protein